MTDRRRPLGTEAVRAATEADTKLPSAPRAQLAAQLLPTSPTATNPARRPTTGRRVLGAGPGTAAQSPSA
ncbi:hypothetical protein ACIF8T_36125 [Streptomyces sp. NPDC085946]|uniref:hypothetical protein n=1 Tax=Streptomyces sp. NPDC085946 TaxID=3365744 RepID=UPI0037D983D0